MYAAAGIVSTAQDMATYMTALLGGRLLDPATYQLMWTSTPTTQYGVKPASDDVYGLGWDTAIDTSSGPLEVAKAGQVPGIHLRAHPLPLTRTAESSSPSTPIITAADPNGVIALQVAQSVYAAVQAGSSPGT